MARACVGHGAMSPQECLIAHTSGSVRAHTMRARRREAVVVRVDNRIIKSGEDGEELSLNDGIVIIITALKVSLAVVRILWSRSIGAAALEAVAVGTGGAAGLHSAHLHMV